MIVYKTLNLCTRKNITGYSDFTKALTGEKRLLNYTINNIINIFLFISFLVMVAGFGTFFRQEFQIPNIVGGLVIIILCIIVFMKGIEGIEKINFILIPFIIIAICILKNKAGDMEFESLIIEKNSLWLIRSVLYSSYNSIILVPILINLSKKIKTKKSILKICVGTFLITLALSFSIFSIIQNNYNKALLAPMPLLSISADYGNRYIYRIVILTAIFTTAIASGYSLLKNLAKNKKQYIYLICGISIIALLLSPIGFGKLLDLLYPILGYLGLIQILLILINFS